MEVPNLPEISEIKTEESHTQYALHDITQKDLKDVSSKNLIEIIKILDVVEYIERYSLAGKFKEDWFEEGLSDKIRTKTAFGIVNIFERYCASGESKKRKKEDVDNENPLKRNIFILTESLLRVTKKAFKKSTQKNLSHKDILLFRTPSEDLYNHLCILVKKSMDENLSVHELESQVSLGLSELKDEMLFSRMFDVVFSSCINRFKFFIDTLSGSTVVVKTLQHSLFFKWMDSERVSRFSGFDYFRCVDSGRKKSCDKGDREDEKTKSALANCYLILHNQKDKDGRKSDREVPIYEYKLPYLFPLYMFASFLFLSGKFDKITDPFKEIPDSYLYSLQMSYYFKGEDTHKYDEESKSYTSLFNPTGDGFVKWLKGLFPSSNGLSNQKFQCIMDTIDPEHRKKKEKEGTELGNILEKISHIHNPWIFNVQFSILNQMKDTSNPNGNRIYGFLFDERTKNFEMLLRHSQEEYEERSGFLHDVNKFAFRGWDYSFVEVIGVERETLRDKYTRLGKEKDIINKNLLVKETNVTWISVLFSLVGSFVRRAFSALLIPNPPKKHSDGFVVVGKKDYHDLTAKLILDILGNGETGSLEKCLVTPVDIYRPVREYVFSREGSKIEEKIEIEHTKTFLLSFSKKLPNFSDETLTNLLSLCKHCVFRVLVLQMNFILENSYIQDRCEKKFQNTVKGIRDFGTQKIGIYRNLFCDINYENFVKLSKLYYNQLELLAIFEQTREIVSKASLERQRGIKGDFSLVYSNTMHLFKEKNSEILEKSAEHLLQGGLLDESRDLLTFNSNLNPGEKFSILTINSIPHKDSMSFVGSMLHTRPTSETFSCDEEKNRRNVIKQQLHKMFLEDGRRIQKTVLNENKEQLDFILEENMDLSRDEVDKETIKEELMGLYMDSRKKSSALHNENAANYMSNYEINRHVVQRSIDRINCLFFSGKLLQGRDYVILCCDPKLILDKCVGFPQLISKTREKNAIVRIFGPEGGIDEKIITDQKGPCLTVNNLSFFVDPYHKYERPVLVIKNSILSIIQTAVTPYLINRALISNLPLHEKPDHLDNDVDDDNNGCNENQRPSKNAKMSKDSDVGHSQKIQRPLTGNKGKTERLEVQGKDLNNNNNKEEDENKNKNKNTRLSEFIFDDGDPHLIKKNPLDIHMKKPLPLLNGREKIVFLDETLATIKNIYECDTVKDQIMIKGLLSEIFPFRVERYNEEKKVIDKMATDYHSYTSNGVYFNDLCFTGSFLGSVSFEEAREDIKANQKKYKYIKSVWEVQNEGNANRMKDCFSSTGALLVKFKKLAILKTLSLMGSEGKDKSDIEILNKIYSLTTLPYTLLETGKNYLSSREEKTIFVYRICFYPHIKIDDMASTLKKELFPVLEKTSKDDLRFFDLLMELVYSKKELLSFKQFPEEGPLDTFDVFSNSYLSHIYHLANPEGNLRYSIDRIVDIMGIDFTQPLRNLQKDAPVKNKERAKRKTKMASVDIRREDSLFYKVLEYILVCDQPLVIEKHDVSKIKDILDVCNIGAIEKKILNMILIEDFLPFSFDEVGNELTEKNRNLTILFSEYLYPLIVNGCDHSHDERYELEVQKDKRYKDKVSLFDKILTDRSNDPKERSFSLCNICISKLPKRYLKAKFAPPDGLLNINYNLIFPLKRKIIEKKIKSDYEDRAEKPMHDVPLFKKLFNTNTFDFSIPSEFWPLFISFESMTFTREHPVLSKTAYFEINIDKLRISTKFFLLSLFLFSNTIKSEDKMKLLFYITPLQERHKKSKEAEQSKKTKTPKDDLLRFPNVTEKDEKEKTKKKVVFENNYKKAQIFGYKGISKKTIRVSTLDKINTFMGRLELPIKTIVSSNVHNRNAFKHFVLSRMHLDIFTNYYLSFNAIVRCPAFGPLKKANNTLFENGTLFQNDGHVVNTVKYQTWRSEEYSKKSDGNRLTMALYNYNVMSPQNTIEVFDKLVLIEKDLLAKNLLALFGFFYTTRYIKRNIEALSNEFSLLSPGLDENTGRVIGNNNNSNNNNINKRMNDNDSSNKPHRVYIPWGSTMFDSFRNSLLQEKEIIYKYICLNNKKGLDIPLSIRTKERFYNQLDVDWRLSLFSSINHSDLFPIFDRFLLTKNPLISKNSSIQCYRIKKKIYQVRSLENESGMARTKRNVFSLKPPIETNTKSNPRELGLTFSVDSDVMPEDKSVNNKNSTKSPLTTEIFAFSCRNTVFFDLLSKITKIKICFPLEMK